MKIFDRRTVGFEHNDISGYITNVDTAGSIHALPDETAPLGDHLQKRFLVCGVRWLQACALLGAAGPVSSYERMAHWFNLYT